MKWQLCRMRWTIISVCCMVLWCHWMKKRRAAIANCVMLWDSVGLTRFLVTHQRKCILTKCQSMTVIVTSSYICESTVSFLQFIGMTVHNIHYTVSTKKLYPCIHCHNSGKQHRILVKFYANTETLNCKQVTKFQQNRSTSATATASFVKSLKSISVHYRHRRDWLSSVRPCEWQDVSTPKVCVYMSTVCSNAS